MAVKINLPKDTLAEDAERFAMTPLPHALFLNSVPKSGSHLVRNIVRMFVPAAQQYRPDFIQLGNFHVHGAALLPQRKLLSWGHLLFTDTTAVALKSTRHILLVRDPYDWVLARARFFLSDAFQGQLNNIKGGAATIEDVLNLMIFGAFGKNPSLAEIYNYNALAWMGTNAQIIKYEEMIRHVKALDTPEADAFFADFLKRCGIERPNDWRERVRIGSDRKHSGTARENLPGDINVPDTLPDAQQRLVDFHAPGLRAALGYG